MDKAFNKNAFWFYGYYFCLKMMVSRKIAGMAYLVNEISIAVDFSRLVNV